MVVDLPKISTYTYMPTATIEYTCNWDDVKNVKLADLHFSLAGLIDLLLGAETFSHILKDGQLASQVGKPSFFGLIGNVQTCF